MFLYFPPFFFDKKYSIDVKIDLCQKISVNQYKRYVKNEEGRGAQKSRHRKRESQRKREKERDIE